MNKALKGCFTYESILYQVRCLVLTPTLEFSMGHIDWHRLSKVSDESVSLMDLENDPGTFDTQPLSFSWRPNYWSINHMT